MFGSRLTVEKVAAIAGLTIPVIAVIWGGAMMAYEIQDMHDRVLRLEASIDAYDEAQHVDEAVNRQVEALAKEVDWLRFHHHDEIGGRGHVD